MQTDPIDDITLLDGTGSLVTYLAISGTLDAFYLKGDGSQIRNISGAALPQGTVTSSAQTIQNLAGTNIISSSAQRSVLGLATTDSPTFANLTLTGNLTAQQLIISSSVIVVTQSYSSGSTIFGNTMDDFHQFTGSVLVTGSVTATSFVGDGSQLTGIVNGLPAGLISGSQQISNFGFVSSSQWNDILNKPAGLVSSSAQTISNLSGSNIVSSSGQRSVLGLGESDSPRFASIYATNGNFDGNLVVGGTLTAQTYVVSSSIVNIQTVDVSGSTIFGDTPNDTHRFTGSVLINGAASSSLGFYGNLTGTSSVASLASTSSYIDPLFISASVAFYGFAGATNVQWNNILFKPTNIISSSGQRSVLGLGENDSPRFSTIYGTNGNFDGNLVVGGTITARTYVISSSVVNYQTLNVSGSTKFGDSSDDVHQFTGSIYTNGSVTSTSFTGSLEGSSSYALTASYALNAGGSTVNTGSFATTASNTFFGNQTINGNIVITGSLTAQQYIVSSSVLYLTASFSSGSTMFGNSLDDTHRFTGSLYVTGALVIPTVQTLSATADVGTIVINSNNLYIYF